MEREYFYTDETVSTNTDLKNEIISSSAPICRVLCAKKQTGGRGRLGRSFFSPSGGLYFSASFPLSENGKNIPSMTLTMGLCVCEALEELCGATPLIKWPNDVMLNGKKLCGILCELISAAAPTVVVGIGINTSAQDGIPTELKSIITSLADEGFYAENDVLMRAIVEKADAAVYEKRSLTDEGSLTEYIEGIRARSFLNGKSVKYTVGGVEINGIFKGISDIGEAIVDIGSEGERRIFCGEISAI